MVKLPEEVEIFLHRLRLAEHPEIRKEASRLFEKYREKGGVGVGKK